ncbi:hypothetical protein BGZ57DRAFT_824975 [Hyaloscypha finlandica]|nr:hypothetical protein BGZ57DRAFT_824975 [Hyaloscypha finlandica]
MLPSIFLRILHMSFSPRFIHIGRLAFPVTFLIFIFYFTLSPHSSTSPSSHSLSSFTLGISPFFSSTSGKSAFIDSISATEIDGPFDNSNLIELCASRKWVEGLIFKCEAYGGGIVEARNVVLNCLRFAIEAGATNFIIPELLSPSDAKTTAPLPFTTLFDLPYFTSTLNTSCPRINLIPHINDLWDKPSTSPAVSIPPNHFPSTPQIPLLHDSILAHPENWSSAFAIHLNTTHPRAPTAQLPVLVNLSPPPLLQFPISYDSEHFITNFGKLVRTEERLRRIAGAVLYALSQRHGIDLSPESRIERGRFYGAVLPGEAEKAAKTKYREELPKNLLLAAERSNLSTIYLATPHFTELEAESIKAFAAKGEVENFIILARNRSTAGFEEEWKEYQTLTPEQKAAVDFEILLRSTQLGGSWETALSWGPAMRRHITASGGAGKWRSLSGSTVRISTSGSKSRVEHPAKNGVREAIYIDAQEEIGKEKSRQAGFAKVEAEEKALQKESEKWTAKADAPPVTTSGERVEGGKSEEKANEKLTVAPDNKMALKKPKPKKLKVGVGAEHCFRDELSVVFGPRAEGKGWVLGVWP